MWNLEKIYKKTDRISEFNIQSNELLRTVLSKGIAIK